MTEASTGAAPAWEAALALYPCLKSVQPPITDPVADANFVSVPAGARLFSEDDPCIGFPLLLEGEISVSRRSDDGRSLELYRLGPGELCLVSSACLFGSRPMQAHGFAMKPTRLLLVHAKVFGQWLEGSEFRQFVLGVFADRMADLTALVDATAFQKLDQRLAAALLGHGPVLAVTHQELANTLGTVREMVSRLLQRFEQQGWIELSRERIRIVDSASLRQCAAGR